MPDAAKAQDATPVQAAPEKPADAPVPPPVVLQPPANGKAPAKKGKSPSDRSGGSPAFTGTEGQPYEIGPEDVLYLNVMHVPEVTGALSVRPDGFVTVQFAGEIKAAGLTTKELSEIVTQKLTTFYNHPEINIQVVKINSKKYYLSGEVKRPGAYTIGHSEDRAGGLDRGRAARLSSRRPRGSTSFADSKRSNSITTT